MYACVSIAHALVGHCALQVLATLFDVGDFNAALDQLGLPAWAALPVAQRVPLDAHVDPARLLPQKLSYFAYAGSLSYPPCTEVCGSCRVGYRAAWDTVPRGIPCRVGHTIVQGVLWVVLNTALTISAEQLAQFPFASNARPLQNQCA